MNLKTAWKVPQKPQVASRPVIIPLEGILLSFFDRVNGVRLICRISSRGEASSHRRSVGKSVSSAFRAELKQKLVDLKALGCTPKSLWVSCLASEQFAATADQIVSLLSGFGLETNLTVSPVDSSISFDYQSGQFIANRSQNGLATKVDIGTHQFRVLIVEDSLAVQKLLANAYSFLPNVEIVGFAESATEALRVFHETKPNFVSLDLNLERSTGLDFLKDSDFSKVMTQREVACALVTDCNPKEGTFVLDAFELGASCYIAKPNINSLVSFQLELKNFFSELDFQWNRRVSDRKSDFNRQEVLMRNFQLIAFGSSTGGTEVLIDILAELPKNAPPILIVQHMPSQFTKMFADRIQARTGTPTIEVRESQPAKRGHIYLAAGGTHLRVAKRKGSGNELMLETDPNSEPVNRFMPSVSELFGSIVEAGAAPNSLAFMLTGMGHDGAIEMTEIKRAGGITIGQSRETCVVYGMPRAVDELGGLNLSLSPDEMFELLSNLFSSQNFDKRVS